MQTPGNFQVAIAAENTAQALEKPNVKPGEGNPQMGAISIRALKGNTGIIYLGGSGVSSANGYELAAGDAINIDITSLGQMFISGTKVGDKVCVFWVGP